MMYDVGELGLPKSDTINGVVYMLTECDKGETAHLFNMDEVRYHLYLLFIIY
jgi:hypothetical protein